MTRTAAVAAVLLAGGCAVLGGDPEPGGDMEPSPVVDAGTSDAEPVADPPSDSAASPPDGLISERMLAGDYEGVLEIYAADSALHADPHATYRAALAAAMSDHPAHDPRRAAQLFQRLLDQDPDTSRRFEVELFIDLLARERNLRSAVRRLDRELQQLKAIDLGEAPDSEP